MRAIGSGATRTLLWGVLAAGAALAAPADAGAQTAGQPALAQGETRSFDIAAQPLGDALAVFGQQSGMQVSADSALLAGVGSPGVRGTMAPEAALRRLLAGTGIDYRLTGADTALLHKPSAAADGDGVVELSPVLVEGQRAGESALGPVRGYVAGRSATATKTDTAIIDTPQSISVIGRDEMEARGVQRLDEALRYTAGVNAATYWNSTTSDPFSIRNFGASTLRDGLRALNNGFDYVVEPYGVERIEVLRGPSAALYGQSEAGGLVNIVTKRPLTTPLREAEVQTGSFERKQAALDVGDALDGGETLFFRLTALGRESGTQVEHIDDDRLYLAPALRWLPDEDTDITLLTSYQADRSAFPTSYPIQGTLQSNPNGEIASDRFMGEPDFDTNDKDNFFAGLDARHRLDGTWTLRQKLDLFHSDVERKEISALVLQADQRTVTRRAEFRPQASRVAASDTSVTAEWMTGPVDVTALAGVDAFDTYFESQRWRGAASNLDIYAPVYGGPVSTPNLIADTVQKQQQIGTYLQGQFTIDGNWIATLGGRYDWAETETTNNLAGTESTQNHEAFTGRAGLVYRFPFGLAPYGSYSESFEPVIGTDAQSQPFEPETGTQYEVGLKYQPTGFDSFVTAALFDITRQNVTTGDPANPGFSVQTGEVHSQGFELEALASLDVGLDLHGAYTFTEAEVTESNGTDLGQRPAYEPRHLASLWADYTLPDGVLEGFGAGAGVRYVGRTYSADGAIKMPSVTLADASVHYQWNDLDLALNVTNLFDKRYYTRCFTTACYIGDVRTFRLTATYQW